MVLYICIYGHGAKPTTKFGSSVSLWERLCKKCKNGSASHDWLGLRCLVATPPVMLFSKFCTARELYCFQSCNTATTIPEHCMYPSFWFGVLMHRLPTISPVKSKHLKHTSGNGSAKICLHIRGSYSGGTPSTYTPPPGWRGGVGGGLGWRAAALPQNAFFVWVAALEHNEDAQQSYRECVFKSIFPFFNFRARKPQTPDPKAVVWIGLSNSGQFGGVCSVRVEITCIKHVLIVRMLDYGVSACSVLSKLLFQKLHAPPDPHTKLIYVNPRNPTHVIYT